MDQNQLTPTPATPPHELKIITKGYESQELAETDLGECGTIFLPRCSHNASTQIARDLPPPKNNNSTYPSIQESCQGVIRHSPHHLGQNFANALEESTGICKREPEKDADNMTMLVAPVAFHFFRETCGLMSTVFLIGVVYVVVVMSEVFMMFVVFMFEVFMMLVVYGVCNV